MADRGKRKNIHYNAKVKEMTIQLWLAGKTLYEIEESIAKFADSGGYFRRKPHRRKFEN